MGLKITQVDAFTSQPFRGDPAVVGILPQPLLEFQPASKRPIVDIVDGPPQR
jgi:hypothetical protein